MNHHVPPITDELGKYWNQPPRDEVLVDDKIAIMTEGTKTKLLNYEGSIPSGKYIGKMWRCGDLLRWYDVDPESGYLSIQTRQIMVVQL